MKKNILSLVALAIIAVSCSTSQKATKVADVVVYKNSITSAELSKHLYIVAATAVARDLAGSARHQKVLNNQPAVDSGMLSGWGGCVHVC